MLAVLSEINRKRHIDAFLNMTGVVSSILIEIQKCAITERRNEVCDESLKNAL